MGIRGWAFSTVVAGSLLGIGAAEARAVDPVVLGVDEAVASEGGGRLILVYGAGVNKVKTWTLNEDGGPAVSPLLVLFKSKTIVALRYPANLVPPTYTLPGNYDLAYTFGTSGTGSVAVRLTGGFTETGVVGATALTAPLLADLNDADTVGGETTGQLHDWGLLTGVPSGFTDGIDDGTTYFAGTGLQLGGATFSVNFTGTGVAGSASRSDHDHDLRYYTETELNSAGGTVNAVGNPVDWSRIKGMPAGFADGVDDGGAGGSYSAGAGLTLTTTVFSVNFAGTGAASTSSRSDHDHDLRYYTETELNASGGTLNNAGNPVDWSRLKGVPAGFADGVDTDTTYSAGTGITLATGAFSVSFSGAGSAGTASRSDHDHSTTYLDLTGGSLSGTLTISASGQAISATSGSSSSTTGGIDCTTSSGVGVAGHGDIGVYGDLDSDGINGVEGRCGYSYQNGIYAYANSGYGDYTSTALFAYHYWNGPAVVGKSYSGVGVYGFSVYGKSGVGVLAVNQSYGTALLVNHTGSSGNLAIFQTYGTNYARIDRYGKGYFNGGTQTYGADFAESVKVDRPAAEFEPGDVMVIDPKAPRQFSLSREAESPLVAGVISTRPALVGTTHDVASQRRDGQKPDWMKEEVRLGIVGIVPTKVCDEGGPIRIGDLLVTSSVPGFAKRGPPSPAVGTVIGKALGALERGKGKVEVLLMAR